MTRKDYGGTMPSEPILENVLKAYLVYVCIPVLAISEDQAMRNVIVAAERIAEGDTDAYISKVEEL